MKGATASTMSATVAIVVRVSRNTMVEVLNADHVRTARAFGLSVLAILRGDESMLLPDSGEALAAGDVLLLRGRRQDHCLAGW